MSALAKDLNKILETENKSIGWLEHSHLKHKRLKTYIALEEINFVWCEKEVKKFRSMWKENYNIWKIAEILGRSHHDVVMLAYDQHLKGRIKTRKGGIFGDARVNE